MQGTLGEAASSGAGAMLLKLVTKINEWKVTNLLALTMSHGLLLKAVAEVLSQVIPQRSGGAAWLDPLRVVRSTVASLLSSSLSFFYWSRLEWVRAITAPGWLRFVFGKTLGTSIAKMVTTQVIYRPINVFLFLGMQSFFRGDSARQLVQVIRKKFKQGIIGGIAFFSVSNMIMFSVPVPYLHPIIGAIAGLIFNVARDGRVPEGAGDAGGGCRDGRGSGALAHLPGDALGRHRVPGDRPHLDRGRPPRGRRRREPLPARRRRLERKGLRTSRGHRRRHADDEPRTVVSVLLLWVACGSCHHGILVCARVQPL